MRQQQQLQGQGGEGTVRGAIDVSTEKTPPSDTEKESQDNDEKDERICGYQIVWTKKDDRQMIQSRIRGMSWEAMSKGCFKGKRSVTALRSRYFQVCSSSGNSKTASSHPVRRLSAHGTHSANQSLHASSIRKRTKERWSKIEDQILLQNIDSVVNNKNWEEILALLPNRTKGAIAARVRYWENYRKFPVIDDDDEEEDDDKEENEDDEEKAEDDEHEKVEKVMAPHVDEKKESTADDEDEKVEDSTIENEDDDDSYSNCSIVI
ncbi:hypothetical protein IV203_009599 [Nitzschia inconspicua]|uniref:Myb-like domain-containing protein n=1 Tax=Nitzschia inconspicua TaxID=303405 RepID=A0A9K3KUK4_9STRA|nr:hypothetical protein IV203_009599 [Nitzschia inconspicua]